MEDEYKVIDEFADKQLAEALGVSLEELRRCKKVVADAMTAFADKVHSGEKKLTDLDLAIMITKLDLPDVIKVYSTMKIILHPSILIPMLSQQRDVKIKQISKDEFDSDSKVDVKVRIGKEKKEKKKGGFSMFNTPEAEA